MILQHLYLYFVAGSMHEDARERSIVELAEVCACLPCDERGCFFQALPARSRVLAPSL